VTDLSSNEERSEKRDSDGCNRSAISEQVQDGQH